MNINAGDVLFEVIGQADAKTIEALPDVRCARIWPYAQYGDAIVQVTPQPGATVRHVLEELRALGLTILAGRRADPPNVIPEPRLVANRSTLEAIVLSPRLL